ncbi:MAG: ATP-binding protein [Candidatus Micrarchaeota archaeon]
MTFSFADLQRAASEGEGPTVELKSSVQKNLGESISALANTSGGLVIIGVGSRGELNGVKDADEESRRIRQALDECGNCNVEQEFVKNEGKTFIALKVGEVAHSQSLCHYKRRCFIRQGTTNVELYGDALVAYLQTRGILNFEEKKSQARLDDLDANKLAVYFKKRGVEFNPRNAEELKTRLAGLKIAGFNGAFYLKNVAPMFFAKDPARHFNNLEARIIVYRGNEKDVEGITFDQRTSGTIPELISATYQLTLQKIGRTQRISGTTRQTVLDYPEEALREAITNAIGHRDYYDPMPTRIELFEDKLVITNPGGLLPGQTQQNFFKNPKHRNPLSYKLLQDFGLGEGLGTGVPNIIKRCRQANLPDPEFNNLGNAFQLILYGPSSAKPRRPLEYENPRQQQAMAFAKAHSKIRTKDLVKLTGVSQPTATADLNELVKQNKLRRVGRFRGAYYETVTLSTKP